jgi:hypothetical protein
MKARASKGTSPLGCRTAVERGGRIKTLGDGGRSRSWVEIIVVLPSKDTSPFILGTGWVDMMLNVEHQVDATAPTANEKAAGLKQFLSGIMLRSATEHFHAAIRNV